MSVDTEVEMRAIPGLNLDTLEALLQECREKLALLDAAYACELQKPLLERRTNFLIFLDKERSVYAFGISLLNRLEAGPNPEGKAGQ